MLAPALLLAATDRARKEITEAEQGAVLQKIADISQHLGEMPESTAHVSHTPESSSRPDPPHAYILGIPARSVGAQITLDVLYQFLDAKTYRVQRLSTATLASEVIARVSQELPDLICITALPSGGLAHARYLCKRLRAQFQQTPILIISPGLREDPNLDIDTVIRRLTEAGADKMAVSLAEAKEQISQMLFPVRLQSVEPKPTSAPVLEQGGIVESLA